MWVWVWVWVWRVGGVGGVGFGLESGAVTCASAVQRHRVGAPSANMSNLR